MRLNPRPSVTARKPTATLHSVQPSEFFYAITPERVLEAVESAGFLATGRCAALNSFENRVYDVELDPECLPPAPSQAHRSYFQRVAKFYRPGRWTRAQILEEHEFLQDLRAEEIPVIAPLPFADGSTLRQLPDSGIYYALFPKVGGRAPDELEPPTLRQIGRLIARIHTVGARKPANHRLALTPDTYGRQNLQYLVEKRWLPPEFERRYQETVEKICGILDPWFAQAKVLRIHGDCHLGNLLQGTEGMFFLDFDDLVRGPAVQDLWLLLPSRGAGNRADLENLLEGYEEMRAFDRGELKLIEGLRALRFVHYSAWLARRWDDPAFPAAFPQFNSHRYWADETSDMERQLTVLQNEGTA